MDEVWLEVKYLYADICVAGTPKSGWRVLVAGLSVAGCWEGGVTGPAFFPRPIGVLRIATYLISSFHASDCWYYSALRPKAVLN